MNVKDFLDHDKHRMLRLSFPDFAVYDCCSVLLAAAFSEVMSSDPDITIGELVIPELTFQLTHTDMSSHLGDVITCEVGLEQSQEDVTQALHAIFDTFGSGQLVFARDISGCWIVGDGTVLYSVWIDLDGAVQIADTWESPHPISAILIYESRVNTDAHGSVENSIGTAYLLHDDAISGHPVMTAVPFIGAQRGKDGLIRGCHFGEDESFFPDVDGDGTVSATDASLILDAAVRIGAGEPSGLTPEQQMRADADRDGTVTTMDAQLVSDFVTAVGAGEYQNTLEGWLNFLNQTSTGAYTSPLHEMVIRDMAKYHTSIDRARLYHAGSPLYELVQIPEIRYAQYYDRYAHKLGELPGAFCRRPVSGKSFCYRTASYGDLVITETTSKDEETTDVLCCGILHKLVGLDASGFFTKANFASAETFAHLFANFMEWLHTHGIPIHAAGQTYLNLGRLPVTEPDLEAADFTGVTADAVLKEFAVLEAGNARMDSDGKLRLGWCEPHPILTVSADVLESLRIGTERLRPATGLEPFLNTHSENVIATGIRADDFVLGRCTTEQGLSTAFRNVVEHFSDVRQIPFNGNLLHGANPYLRAGDTIRAVTRSGTAFCVQIMSQDAGDFPFLQSTLSSPDGTSWTTEPVEIDGLKVTQITVTNWPEYIILGEEPDTSEMIVTAHQRNGDSFTVDDMMYHIEVGPPQPQGNALMRVTFAQCAESKYITVKSALYTRGGAPLLTEDGRFLVIGGE